MKKTNANSKLLIFVPSTPNSTSSGEFVELKYVTELKTNLSYKKEDRTYFHNSGDVTSLTTGRTVSLSVAVDLTLDDKLHQYLYNLATQKANECNNQEIKLELLNLEQNNKYTEMSGKATFNFKNFFPSGNADELAVLGFDIFPQDESFSFNTIDKTSKDTQASTQAQQAESVNSGS